MNNKNILRWVLSILVLALLLPGCSPNQIFKAENPPSATDLPNSSTYDQDPEMDPTETPNSSIVDSGTTVNVAGSATFTCTYQVGAYEHSTANQYLDTGIDLVAGENLSITASGTACFDNTDKYFCSSPDGHPDFVDADLVGKIGDGNLIRIGSNYQATIGSDAGRLYLGFHDNDYENNSGYFEVTVTVENAPSVNNCNP